MTKFLIRFLGNVVGVVLAVFVFGLMGMSVVWANEQWQGWGMFGGVVFWVALGVTFWEWSRE